MESTDTQWRDWLEDCPGWEASGKNVEMLLNDGSIVRGTAFAEEFWTGEDEVAVFHVLLPDGREISPFDAKYRFL